MAATAFPADDVEGSVPARFARIAAARGDALAIVSEVGRLTYRELDRRSHVLAAAILGAGGPLDVPVAVHAEAPATTILSMLATWKAGRFCVPLDPTLPAARREAILRDAEAGLVVSDGAPPFDVDARPVIRLDTLVLDAGGLPRRLDIGPDGVACLLYTSGSTGAPKGVVRTHRNLLHRARCAVDSLGIGPDDRVSALHSPAFGAGLRDVLAALLGGATLLPFDVRRAGMAALADWIERERITVLCAVVTTLRHFLGSLEAGRRFPSIRIIRLGSEALFREDVERLRARLVPGCVLVAGYGASEASGIVEYRILPGAALAPGRVPAGYPLEGVEILILGDDGAPRPAGEAGEIAVRSRYLSPGYWRRPDGTRATFTADAAGDAPRVYRTGDLGRLAPDGCLELIGRLDHQVKIRGYLVHPDEIERRLLEHEEIRQASVVGRDDGAGGTRLVAYLVPTRAPAPAPAALRRFLQARLPDYMIPAAFVSLDALPVTPSGKIDRHRLPESPASMTHPGDYAPPTNPLELLIVKIWEDLLGARGIGVNADFFELGGDSLRAAAFVTELERASGRALSPSALLEASTAQGLARLILREREELEQPLITLRATGARTPLFYLHGDYNGGGLYCHGLARGLDPDRPFYILNPHGLDGRPLPGTIEAMAAERLAAVRAARPHGPYHLAGYCNGGHLALEMARRLRDEGERVSVTVLIEAEAPGQHRLQRAVLALTRLAGLPRDARIDLAARADRLVERATDRLDYYRQRLRALRADPWRGPLAVAARRIHASAGPLARIGGRTPGPAATPAPRSSASPADSGALLVRARLYRPSMRRYAPASYDGRVVVLRAEERPAGPPDLGWKQTLPRLEVGTVTGGHLSCITRHVDAFAARLEEILRQGDEHA
jgi:amino acid adenylation domain-containing protein